MNSKKILTIIYVLLCSSVAMFSQNMLINGDFEAGGSGLGFIVNGPGYTLINPPYTGTVPGNYTFATDPQVVNPIFVSGGDHTSGTGRMLIIDATTMGGSRFWRPGNTGGSICGITIGTVYTFSFWVKSISTTTVGLATQPNIGFFLLGGNNVNPPNLNTVVQLPAAGWQKVLYTFTATSTCINIELFNNNTSAVGNDFAVDDFYLAAPPLPVTLSESFSNPTCQGLTDGTITASASYGTAPYNFTLTGPVTQTNTTGFFTGLAPGTYAVSVTDSAPTPGTVNHSGIVLVDPPGLTVTASNTSICNGSSTTLSVSGSGLPVHWTASPADPSLTTANSNSTNPLVSPTQTTTYTVMTTALSSVNLIVNPDFSAGNTGFTTDYTYLTVTNPGGQQGTYGIAPNSQGWFAGFSSCNDHTGGGNMYVSDGSIFNGGNDRVWCQTVTVIPGADYTFSYWSQNVASGNPANLDVVINGTSIGASLVPTAVCSWVKKTYIWNSGSNTSAQICLYDRVIVGGGNDFAIDDISFMAVPCSLTKSITITVTNTVNLTITDPPAVCSGTVDITLPAVTAGSTAGTTLTYWMDSTATSPLGSPSAIGVGGTYYIKSTLGSCSIIKPVVVTISGSGSIAAPVVVTPLYLCQGSTASALTATALPGAALNWYGTNATGGTASSTAPIPSTATLGTTTYYVSQTVGSCEGPRAAINVIVSSGTGTYNIFCDPSQATTPNSVFFDWSNIAGLPHVYTISYSINGGTPVIANTNLSSYEVFGVTPGQSVFLTIVSNLGAPCVASESYTCSLCTTTAAPIFASIPTSICSGSVAPVLPSTSDNGISGTWAPLTVSNTTGGNYVFTPNALLFPCTGPITKVISVATQPIAGTLSGNQNVCSGLTTTFTSTVPSGGWSSSDITIATVNPSTGVVTGIAAGTATITYTVTGAGGCINAIATRTVTVTAAPIAGTLSGTQNICIGTTTTFSSTVSGGTWSSSSVGTATVSNTGVVTAVATGTATITYTVAGTGGCANAVATRTVTIAALPVAGILSGNQNVCSGLTTTFTSTIPSGGWSSSDTTIATVNPSTGVVTGVTAGTATIIYTVTGTGGCANATGTRSVTVTAAPIAGTLSGTQNICIGTTTTFSSTVSGGTWSSSSVGTATVSNTGVVTAVAAGTATINYTVIGTGGCTNIVATRTVTIAALPVAGTLSGIQNVCTGLTTTFTSTVVGGAWSSSNNAVATVNITTGVITGVSAGTAIMTYTVTGTGGCASVSNTRTVTVSLPPNAGTLSGNQTVCEGSTVSFSSTVAGGNWITSDNTIATINITTGLITGIAAGTTTIAYTVTGTGGCANVTATRTITVTNKVIPTFNPVSAVCSGTIIPALPTTSINGYTGTWSPAINNTATTIYTFTPTAGQCAKTATLTINITQKITPQFDPIAIQCHNNPVVPVLPTVSTNGIRGTWSPAVSLATIGTQTYTFTPNTGECVTTTVVTLPITVVGITNPNFTNINLCSGKTAPILSTISPNGVEGTWSPAVINNTVTGTYLFTPNTVINQCATPKTITVTIIPRTVPNFPAVMPFCVGTTAPTLNLISPNGINGTWLPATIDNTIIGTSQYVFTPASSECATTFTLDVTVTEPLVPNFPNINLCLGITPPVLGLVSPNGISGTWVPAVIDNTILGTTPYLFTPNAGECGVAKSIDVTVNEYNLTAIEGIVSNYFDDLQIITVLASGPGDYLYQLDYGPKQESNIFQNVPAGLHTVTVYDRNNCGPAISDPNILVINYPKFFTPNDDGFNDKWNIFGLSNQPNSRIYIFDRYGKLLKEISPAGEGWDGTYNGKPMPGSDYWFSVDYLENNLQKQFKAHFSIKR